MWLKRCLDISVAIVCLLLLAPVMLGVALLIRIYLGSPVLFRQQRGGLHGGIFTLIKFRTMKPPDASLAASDPLDLEEARLTPLGRWLRQTHLDELPELWNILRGDMSLVGPRPLLAAYLTRYTPEQQRRHDVRPGLTGWAQIQGGNALSWEEKFARDLWYVEHRHLGLDLKILWITLQQVLFRRTTQLAEPAVVAEFQGAPRDKNPQDSVQKETNG